MLVFWVLSTAPAHAGLVINEIMADPGIADANCDGVIDISDDEFVEIVNLGPGSVDLTGAVLADGQQDRYTFAGGILDEGQAVVVFAGGSPVLDGSAAAVAPWCGEVGPDVIVLTAGAALSLNNGGDTVDLRSGSGLVLATATYGASAGNDEALVLDPELYGLGYVLHSTLGAGELTSPGHMADLGPFVLGGTPVGCDEAGTVSGLVVNEVQANPSGADTDLEWVELYNGTGRLIELSAYALASGTQSLSSGAPFPVGTMLDVDQHLVVGQTAIAEVDVVAGGFSLGNASSNADAVQLMDCNGAPVDTVVYGTINEDAWLDDTGAVASSLAPIPPDGGSISRLPDGVDSDLSGDDFVETPFPTPGAANDAPIEGCGGIGSGIVVNELLPNPEGADDDGGEWVELYHGGTDDIDLDGWAIQVGTASFREAFVFGAETLRPGDYLLVDGGTDEFGGPVSLGMGNAGSSSDAVRLVDCAGVPTDTVIYGQPNTDGYLDDLGELPTLLAPVAGEGASLARVSDGFDTDDSGTDFVVTLEPTPGAPNAEVEPVECVPTTGSVTINEFVPDPDGADEGLEWIELHNRSANPVSVAGWAVAAGTTSYDSRDVTLPGGVMIPAEGFLVVGGDRVDEADVVQPFSLGNGTETDGLRLFDCEGTSVDTVLYGEDPNADAMTDDAGMVVPPYGDPGSNESMARVADGADTDTAEDWIVKGAVTPGEPNVRELGVIVDPVGDRGCGCGGRDPGQQASGPEARDPQSSGCATVPLPGSGVMAWLVAGAAFRRRR